jgi:hypothetical protein
MEARWKRKRSRSDPSSSLRVSGCPDISADIAIRPRFAAPRARLPREIAGSSPAVGKRFHGVMARCVMSTILISESSAPKALVLSAPQLRAR